MQIHDATSVSTFKHQVMLHYQAKLQQPFNVNYMLLGVYLEVSAVCVK